jgi:hypothetical protein
MLEHHQIWLENHPERNKEWLQERLQDGSHIHHVDNCHANNVPENLILVDATDHVRLHGINVRSHIRPLVQVKAEQRSKGRFLGGSVPFGYMVDDVGNILPHDAQQAAIVEMRAMRAAGLALRPISDRMKAKGFDLSHQGVKEVLERTTR